MAVVDVSRGAAGAGRGAAPALLLHPGGAVRIELPAHREGGAQRQVSLGVLNSWMLVSIIVFSLVVYSASGKLVI